MMNIAGKMREEIEALQDAKKQLADRFDKLSEAHTKLLSKQEQAYDNDVTGNLENDVYVFCLWILRRFGTIREGFVVLDTSGGGTVGLAEMIEGRGHQLRRNCGLAEMIEGRAVLDSGGGGTVGLAEMIEGRLGWRIVVVTPPGEEGIGRYSSQCSRGSQEVVVRANPQP